MLRFRTPPPEVRLVNAFEDSFDGAVAAARTCYSAKGIVTPAEVAGDALESVEERDEAKRRRDALAKDIFQAGHHTVYQHAHFQFAIDRVSRHSLWAFFHAHPFYNSEQVSQRYVKVARGQAVVPELGPPAQQIYEQTLELQQDAYYELTRMLVPVAQKIFFAVFPARQRQPDKWRREIRRKAQEAARYVLPVATWARLYHTVSALTLLRYHRAARQFDVPTEIGLIVEAMIDRVLAKDSSYRLLIEAPLPLDVSCEARTFERLGGVVDPRRAERFAREFDAQLDGRVSRLVGYSNRAEQIVAQAVREVLGSPRATLSDDDAIALAADPACNVVYGDALNLATVSKITRALHHAQYTFSRKVSHTADSQDQRHRMTPASRPVLLAHLQDGPDVILPSLVAADDAARQFFAERMEATWDAITRLRRLDVPDEALVYLLPNAVAVRATESADYNALKHKHAMRLCYNAQEEIWHSSLDEALQIREVHPRLGAYLEPPCTIRHRADKTPYCPEGKRYCGVPVWRQLPQDYIRRM
ncbi:MAG: FAD-dependent thymidylate synthase [Acidobacteriota bacterium]|nr:MAG: FAD-dependent thymidylate synthase [Acidobacteriota bacterium]